MPNPVPDVIEVIGLDIGDDDMIEQLEQRRNVRTGSRPDLEGHAPAASGSGVTELSDDDLVGARCASSAGSDFAIRRGSAAAR